MADSPAGQELSRQLSDHVATMLKGTVGACPIAGPMFAELFGALIPNQQIDRLARYVQIMDVRLRDVDNALLRSQLANENFTDLMEEGARQAVRAVSDERRTHIADLMIHTLRRADVNYIQAKHLLRLLGEINDIELIRLGAYAQTAAHDYEAYREKHYIALDCSEPEYGAPPEDWIKFTICKSYDEHLAQLGLLTVKQRVNRRNNQVELDPFTGAFKKAGYAMTSLGNLLLRHVGIEGDDAT